MKTSRIIRAVCVVAFVVAATSGVRAYDGWHLVDQIAIEGKASGWDYLTYDGVSNRLFVGFRKNGLHVVDMATKKVIKIIEGTAAASSNGVVLMPEFDLAISNNENGTITPFRLSTLEASPPIKLGAELDTSHYDPFSKRVFVNMDNAEAKDMIVLEAPSLKVIGKIAVGA